MNFKSIATLSLLGAALTACNQNRVQVTESGLKYQMHEDKEETRKAKVGDILTLQMTVKNSKDSVLGSSYKNGSPIIQQLQVPSFKGSLEEGLAMLSKGDSATIFVSSDSLAARSGQPLPAFIPKGSDLSYTIRVVEVQSEEEFQKAQASQRDKQKGVDDKLIAAYIAKNSLSAKKTPSGVYYVVSQPGAGAVPSRGDVVKVKYTGKTLDGKVFDSSNNQPQTAGGIDFPLGMGAAIPGWEDGLMQLPKGSKATLIIPSTMAYGQQGAGDAIKPNTVISFDVEVVDIKKGAAARGGGMPGGN
ncbi:FKBP-type peptidyl-prolyl cis-trans isomerase [Tellurirhabdus rosea]|uniref:FKBP-type peptidyl-prolyl cis-trans isomerase n=1 Tax=Tellurirhabdus rosea TaxID=2674997 RepID=UPI00224FB51B|nr:FKBP-type peptidyl-prolyl cis-trans isomerase [Tellurirhabdus rosea]